MNSTIRAATAISMAATIAAASGCGTSISHIGSDTVTAKNPSALALIFVDVSKSTYGKAGTERTRYSKYFQTILAGLPEGTLVKGDQIARNPLSDTAIRLNGFIEKYGGLTGSKNKDDVDAANAATRSKLRQQFSALLNHRQLGSSILDSLNIAENVFDSYPSVTTKYLVVFSDMNEYSTRYRFTRANLTPSRIRLFISKERRDGRLPNLQSVLAYVAGAGFSTPPAQVRAVERFWLMYFKAAGARLPAYRYGPAPIRFP